MKAAIRITRAIFGLIGLALIALGISFWSGHLLSLVRLHMMLGMLFVLCMWLLVVLAFIAGSARGLAVVVLVWSVIVPIFGMAQLRLLPGSRHWLVQAAHLLIGLIAMGLGHSLARRIAAPSATSPVRVATG
jgi:hypothetical protein